MLFYEARNQYDRKFNGEARARAPEIKYYISHTSAIFNFHVTLHRPVNIGKNSRSDMCVYMCVYRNVLII